MEIRKWMIVMIIIAVVGKIFAWSVSKVMVLPQVAQFEKMAEQKMNQIFKHDAPTAPIELENFKKPTLPKKDLTKVALKPLPPLGFKPFNPVLEKKSPQAQVAEEKERRKKRKKKLEKEADKKKQPELTVTKLGGDEKIKPKTSTDEVVGGVIIPPQKEEEKVETVQKVRVDLSAWVRILSTQPIPANLVAFVNLYKNGDISAMEYYTVMSTLQKSKNKEVRKIAIQGSSVEPHVLGFSILVHEKYSETVVELQTLVASKLSIYKNSKYLSVLLQALATGDMVSKVEASDTVGAIAQSLKGSSVVLTADLKNILNHSIVMLTPLTKDGVSKELQASATQTIKFVKEVLGITT